MKLLWFLISSGLNPEQKILALQSLLIIVDTSHNFYQRTFVQQTKKWVEFIFERRGKECIILTLL